MDKGYAATGVVLYLAGAPVDWKSLKETVVAVSTQESEYVTLSKGGMLILHLRHLLKRMSRKQARRSGFFMTNWVL